MGCHNTLIILVIALVFVFVCYMSLDRENFKLKEILPEEPEEPEEPEPESGVGA